MVPSCPAGVYVLKGAEFHPIASQVMKSIRGKIKEPLRWMLIVYTNMRPRYLDAQGATLIVARAGNIERNSIGRIAFQIKPGQLPIR